MMLQYKIGCVPIVDHLGDTNVGIVTESGFVRAFALTTQCECGVMNALALWLSLARYGLTLWWFEWLWTIDSLNVWILQKVIVEGLETALLDNGALPGDVANDKIYVGQVNIQHQQSIVLSIQNTNGDNHW